MFLTCSHLRATREACPSRPDQPARAGIRPRGSPRGRRPARSHPGTFELASPKSRAAMSFRRAFEAASRAKGRRPWRKGVREGFEASAEDLFPNRGQRPRTERSARVRPRSPDGGAAPGRERKPEPLSLAGRGQSGTRRLFTKKPGRFRVTTKAQKVVQPRVPVARTRRPQLPPSGNGGTRSPAVIPPLPRHPASPPSSRRKPGPQDKKSRRVSPRSRLSPGRRISFFFYPCPFAPSRLLSKIG